MYTYKFLHTKSPFLQEPLYTTTNTERAFSVMKEVLPKERHEKQPFKATQTVPNFLSTQRRDEASRSRGVVERARTASDFHRKQEEELTKTISMKHRTDYLRYPWSLSFNDIPPSQRFRPTSKDIGENGTPEATRRQIAQRDVYRPRTSELLRMQNFLVYKAPGFNTAPVKRRTFE